MKLLTFTIWGKSRMGKIQFPVGQSIIPYYVNLKSFCTAMLLTDDIRSRAQKHITRSRAADVQKVRCVAVQRMKDNISAQCPSYNLIGGTDLMPQLFSNSADILEPTTMHFANVVPNVQVIIFTDVMCLPECYYRERS